MFKWLIKRIKATTVALSGLRWIGVGLAATEEVDDTAPRRDPTAPEEDSSTQAMWSTPITLDIVDAIDWHKWY